MINITVKGIGDLTKFIGSEKIHLTFTPQVTLRLLLTELVVIYGRDFEKRIINEDNQITRDIRVLINGQNIYFLSGLNTELSDGDHILIIPPLAGG